MRWVAPVGAWVHCFPVTKLQFEIFLAHQDDPRLGADAYAAMCSGNARVAPQDLSEENYWNAFVTGVLPREAEAFACWCGSEYRLPTVSDWWKILEALDQPGLWEDNPPPIPDDTPARRALLVRRLDAIARSLGEDSASRSLADWGLMRRGVVEWVCDSEQPQCWGGLGEPPLEFAQQLSSLELKDQVEPLDPEHKRVLYFGFRLLRVPRAES